MEVEGDGSPCFLLVDHDQSFADALRGVVGERYPLRHVGVHQAILLLTNEDLPDAILLNWDQCAASLRAQERPPSDLLKAVSELPYAPPVIVYSSDSRRETALEAIRHGAFEFFTQPLDVGQLKLSLSRAKFKAELLRELASARKLLLGSVRVEGLLGNSKQIERIHDVVSKISGVNTTVLIRGESGTGKEVVARAIHNQGTRATKLFVPFSPCALPDTLIEDELFGHERGAFTGASQSRRGRFEEANGGTIFLDEIGDLALPLQSKLLRVLQERKLNRLGSNSPVPVDVRVVCATNRDLELMVQEGTFRQDLYYRISVVRIDLPPLRDRKDDIPLLAEFFCRKFASLHQRNIRGLSPGFLTALVSYNWPGNVRELQNVIERSLVLAEGHQLVVTDLPPEMRDLAIASEIPRGSFNEAVRCFKRELVKSALQLHSGNRLKAAKELRISRCYLHRLLKQLNIEGGESPAPANTLKTEPPEDATVPVAAS